MFIIVWVGALISVGFLRDFIFVTLNARLSYLWYQDPFYYEEWGEIIFGQFSYYPLYYTKFILTFLFSFIYLAITFFIVKIIFPNARKYYRFIVMSYVVITVASLLIFGGGYLVEFFYDPEVLLTLKKAGKAPSLNAYHLSRYIMGFVQSPILSAILILSLILYKRGEDPVVDSTS